ncbi:RHS repeat-associated core domain-containing protein [uncultured Bacteroides sp.]|uniref:RHS repeat domain-containing protein n=1 Tax=uncultured Bacteroides sp. TaxID=162156 RepID=UPI002AA94B1C|nr:RHS repeat-associated core domain-containing protein [uncultured Bacteroides sp.]
MYYDYRGRVIQTKSNNHLTGGIEKAYVAYNFTGQPIQKKHIHSATGKTTQTELYTYTYDHAGRLLTTKHKLNTAAEVTLAEDTYDELGRLKTSKKNNQSNLATTYTYNVRSWMKSSASPLFSQTLYYNDSYGNNTPSYNGNISAMSWTTSGDKTRGYNFAYDNLSRLTAAGYLEGGTANTSYGTSYNYDKHGNMTNLVRNGRTGTSTFDTVDNLSMSYAGNQLIKADDTGTTVTLSASMDFKNNSTAAKEYYYDLNGNLTQDLNKGITGITYNFLNLPQSVTINNTLGQATNTYTYAADGRKLRANIGSKQTDYVGNVIYEGGALKRILVDGGYIEGGAYYFYLTDHLGNNRVVANASGGIVQTNHYYPFGMSFAEGVTTSGQPYKYNGKELDTERGLNLYDYSARLMDPALGRFSTVDPKSEKYYSVSPYVYCANNSVDRVDPDGRDWRVQTKYNPETDKIEYIMTVNAVLYNNSSNRDINMEQLATSITKQVNDTYNTSGNDFVAKMNFNLKVVDSSDEIGERDHVFQIVDQRQFRTIDSQNGVAANASSFGLSINIGTNLVENVLNGRNQRTLAHELGHTGGLEHLSEKKDINNLMMQASPIHEFGGNYNESTQIYHSQIEEIRNNYINDRLNQYSPLIRTWYGKKILGK